MDISIIIPVFNEEKNLPILHKQISDLFDKLSYDYEIIYINDGSLDGSFTILKDIELRDDNVKTVCLDKNYGQTTALGAGIKIANGDFILSMDADLTYDVNDLTRIIQKLDKYDVVAGYRSNRKAIDGFVKFACSKIANYVRNMVLNENFKDAGCFLRGCRRKCLADVVLYKGFQVFIVSLLNMKGHRIKEIEVKVRRRMHGKSKYNIRNRIFKELAALFVVKWMKRNALKYKTL